MQEVEVKYLVSDESALLSALAGQGIRLSEPVRQDDQAYAPASWRYGMSKRNVTFARLRTQSGRHLFTVKRPLDNELACVEHETVVADRAQMHDALLIMGFVPTVRITKTRRTGTWGEVTVCVDVVGGLGVFLEVETMAGENDAGTETQERLHSQVVALGVAVERVTHTYDSLLRARSNGEGRSEEGLRREYGPASVGHEDVDGDGVRGVVGEPVQTWFVQVGGGGHVGQ
ncbi:CYTH domain-containing protein [Micromonospora echinofusca]|uniref:class IV adenylate cyclase n=1 Tax=Micromonospora echinofusca TaxID=47858 RepID=UPI000C7119A9